MVCQISSNAFLGSISDIRLENWIFGGSSVLFLDRPSRSFLVAAAAEEARGSLACLYSVKLPRILDAKNLVQCYIFI
jgi:hypothetical protein